MQANWNSSLVSLLIIVCLGWLPNAWAQGLGEMTLGSRINEPFSADIELLDIGELDATQIVVDLATQDEFINRGLERTAVLSSLQFEVEVTGGGSGVIHVSSLTPIEEPFLNFLISARWPNGRMLREYTALLDLPAFPEDSEPAPAAAVQSPQANAPAATPAPAETAATSAVAAAGQEYTVQNGDSMWQIAASVRPGNDVSVQQMMVAIQRTNEGAFINNNINRVRSGHVLRIPGREEISVIDQEAAIAAVNQQNQQLSAQPLAVNDTVRPADPGAANDELTLLSGNDSRGAGTGGVDGELAALENELMLSEENLDRSRLENLELTNRLAALQEQVDLLQNMIALEDARIARLQAELSEQAAQTEQSLAETQAAADTLANAETVAADEGVTGLLKNTAVWAGGLLALVLLALGVLMVRKRNTALADDETFDFDVTEAEARAAAAATIEQENTVETEKPAREGLTWAAAVAAFFARFRKQEAVPEETTEEQPPAEVTGGSYGPDAAFRNPEAAEAQVEPMLQTEEELLAAEAMADEAFEQVEQDEAQQEEPALSENGTISYVEPTFSPHEDLEAEAGDLLAAVTPPPVVDERVESTEVETVTLVDPMPEETVQQEVVPEAGELDTPDVFEFSLRTEAAAETSAVTSPPEPEPEIESIEFSVPDETPASAHASEYRQVADMEPPAEDIPDDLVDLAFDDTFVADAAEEDSSYMPTAPNNAQDAKLDLAVAYEAMGDLDGAIEILDEVIGAGSSEQVAEAERLKAKWQNS